MNMSERDAIRSKCACKHDDARTCYEVRYPQPVGEDERTFPFDFQCDCPCHRELQEIDSPELWEERP